MKFKSISVYDKSDNLISYVEYQDDTDVKCYYNATGTRLMRKFTNNYSGDETIVNPIDGSCSTSEVVSSILEYDDNITLYPLQVYGETTMRILNSGTTTLSTANVVSRVDSYADINTISTNTSLTSSSYTTNFSNTSIECHTVSQNLIDNLKNKL
jgi:hypothetical protein